MVSVHSHLTRFSKTCAKSKVKKTSRMFCKYLILLDKKLLNCIQDNYSIEKIYLLNLSSLENSELNFA